MRGHLLRRPCKLQAPSHCLGGRGPGVDGGAMKPVFTSGCPQHLCVPCTGVGRLGEQKGWLGSDRHHSRMMGRLFWLGRASNSVDVRVAHLVRSSQGENIPRSI